MQRSHVLGFSDMLKNTKTREVFDGENIRSVNLVNAINNESTKSVPMNHF